MAKVSSLDEFVGKFNELDPELEELSQGLSEIQSVIGEFNSVYKSTKKRVEDLEFIKETIELLVNPPREKGKYAVRDYPDVSFVKSVAYQGSTIESITSSEKPALYISCATDICENVLPLMMRRRRSRESYAGHEIETRAFTICPDCMQVNDTGRSYFWDGHF
jgi:hypothetical protein